MSRKKSIIPEVLVYRKFVWYIYTLKETPISIKNRAKDFLVGEEGFIPEVGSFVNYHSVIGKEVTQADMEVRSLDMLNSGDIVVWLVGKPGFVALESLSCSN